jgi:hypothetical protein
MKPPQSILDGGRVITERALFDAPTSRGWLGWQNSNREMVGSVCVAIVSKLANLSVIETVILSSSAKPYLGAKVQSF